MDGHGLTEGFGHLSSRLPDGSIAISPAMGPGMAADEGLYVSFSIKGERLDTSELPAPLETSMHLAIYAMREDVSAICRTHSPFMVSYGVRSKELHAFHGFGSMLGESVPFLDFTDLISDSEKAEKVVMSLGSNRGLLLRGNGGLVVGESIKQAVIRAIYLEEAARIAVHRFETVPQTWSSEEVRSRHVWHAAEVNRAWDYYRWKYCRS